jgi:hypothetical protein
MAFAHGKGGKLIGIQSSMSVGIGQLAAEFCAAPAGVLLARRSKPVEAPASRR